MVSRIVIGRSFKGLVRYQFEGRKDHPQDKQAVILGSSGVRTDSSAHMIADFQLGCQLNPGLAQPVWHASLSFNPDDEARLSNPQLLAIARGYLRGMGLEHTQYVIVRHHDQPDNQHVHLIANRIGNDGKTCTACRNFFRSQQLSAALVQEHGLTPARGQRVERQHPERFPAPDRARYDIREALRVGLTTASNLDTLTQHLGQQGIATRLYHNAQGQATGISFAQHEYKFKGSALGQEYSLPALETQLRANQARLTAPQLVAQASRNLREQVQAEVTRVLAETLKQPPLEVAPVAGWLHAVAAAGVRGPSPEQSLAAGTYTHQATGEHFSGRDLRPNGRELGEQLTDLQREARELQQKHERADQWARHYLVYEQVQQRHNEQLAKENKVIQQLARLTQQPEQTDWPAALALLANEHRLMQIQAKLKENQREWEEYRRQQQVYETNHQRLTNQAAGFLGSSLGWKASAARRELAVLQPPAKPMQQLNLLAYQQPVEPVLSLPEWMRQQEAEQRMREQLLPTEKAAPLPHEKSPAQSMVSEVPTHVRQVDIRCRDAAQATRIAKDLEQAGAHVRTQPAMPSALTVRFSLLDNQVGQISAILDRVKASPGTLLQEEKDASVERTAAVAASWPATERRGEIER